MIRIGKKNKITKKSKRQLTEEYFSCFTESQLLEFDYMINNGPVYKDIIKIIQDEWGCFEGRAQKTLLLKMYDYNTLVLKPKLAVQVEGMDVYKELLALKDKIDSLKEYTVLVLHQKERLDRILAVEKMIGTISEDGMSKNMKEMSSQARREIKLMGDLLEKLANIQMKTGVLKVAPRLISGEIAKDDDRDPQKITFKIREDFMDHMDEIKAELIDVIDLEEIEQSVQTKVN